MRDGAIMANSGHFDAELDLTALREMAEGHVRDVRENVQEFDLGGKRLNLIAEGRLVNLGAAEGHPAAVMDMSFANQALSAEYVAGHHAELEPQVYVVPEAIDAEVARLKLAALGITLDADDARAEGLRLVLAARHLSGVRRRRANGRRDARRRSLRTGAWASPFPIELPDAGVVALGEIGADGGRAGGSRAGPTRRAGARSSSGASADGTVDRPDARGLQRPLPGPRVRRRRRTSSTDDLVVVSDFVDRPAAPRSPRPRPSSSRSRRSGAWRYADLIAGPRAGPAHRDPRGPRAGDARPPRRGRERDRRRSTSRAARSRSSSRGRLLRGAAPVAGRHAARLARVGPPEHAVGRHGRCASATVDDDGSTRRAAEHVAGSQSDWIAQPRWSPDGVLHFVAEPDGWMNLFRLGRRPGRGGRRTSRRSSRIPTGSSASPTYGFAAPTGRSWRSAGRGGRDRLYRDRAGAGAVREIELPFTEMSSLAVDGDRVVLRAAAPDRPAAIVELDPATGAATALRRATQTPLDPGGRRDPAARRVPDDRRPDRVRPLLPADEPLVPRAGRASCRRSSSRATAARPRRPPRRLTVLAQLFTSRGLRGPRRRLRRQTGYGRDYRKRLEGEWGVVDLDDCVRRRPLARRAGARRRRAAGDPRRQRQRLHDALRGHVPRRVQGRDQLLRDRRPRDVRAGDPQVRVALHSDG